MPNLPNLPNHSPFPLNFRQLPPNHNPLIFDEPESTYDNIHSSLCLLTRLVKDSEQLELTYSERETCGLLCVLECMEQAMRFELFHREEE